MAPTAVRGRRRSAGASAPTSEIPLTDIYANPLNPRREFPPEPLEELAASLRQHGLIQPIAVAPREEGGYWLIAGERRWRAAQIAGLSTLPAYVREVADDREALELMLSENLQRENLSAIEEAEAYQKLAGLGLTQTQIAERVGRSQPHVANTLRLLQLPESVRARVQSGTLAASAGRALLPLARWPRVADAMAELVGLDQVRVRDLERDPLATREWELSRAGILRTLDSRTPWEWESVCRRSCPHEAFRRVGTGLQAVCLNPACYDALAAAAPPAETRGPEEIEASEPAGADLPRPPVAASPCPVAEPDPVVWRACRRFLTGGRALGSGPATALLVLETIRSTPAEIVEGVCQELNLPRDLAALEAADRQAALDALSRHAPTVAASLALGCLLWREPELAAWLIGNADTSPGGGPQGGAGGGAETEDGAPVPSGAPPNGRTTLTPEQVREMRRRYAAGDVTQQALGKEYGISRSGVAMILSGARWREVAE